MSARTARRRRKQYAMNNKQAAKIGRRMPYKPKKTSVKREERWRKNKAKGLF